MTIAWNTWCKASLGKPCYRTCRSVSRANSDWEHTARRLSTCCETENVQLIVTPSILIYSTRLRPEITDDGSNWDPWSDKHHLHRFVKIYLQVIITCPAAGISELSRTRTDVPSWDNHVCVIGILHYKVRLWSWLQVRCCNDVGDWAINRSLDNACWYCLQPNLVLCE